MAVLERYENSIRVLLESSMDESSKGYQQIICYQTH